VEELVEDSSSDEAVDTPNAKIVLSGKINMVYDRYNDTTNADPVNDVKIVMKGEWKMQNSNTTNLAQSFMFEWKGQPIDESLLQ